MSWLIGHPWWNHCIRSWESETVAPVRRLVPRTNLVSSQTSSSAVGSLYPWWAFTIANTEGTPSTRARDSRSRYLSTVGSWSMRFISKRPTRTIPDLVSVNRASGIQQILVESLFGAMMVWRTTPIKSKATAQTLLARHSSLDGFYILWSDTEADEVKSNGLDTEIMGEARSSKPPNSACSLQILSSSHTTLSLYSRSHEIKILRVSLFGMTSVMRTIVSTVKGSEFFTQKHSN